MKGLRTQETNEFISYFKIVQSSASKTDCVFFLDTGEGRDFSYKNIYCEDLSGWLIPKLLVSKFENDYLKFEENDNSTTALSNI